MKKILSFLRIQSTQSFTLVELLIVVGILAILTAAIVLILNPAELLRQSRDTTRMSDLASIHSTISLALTQDPVLSLGTASTVYISLPDTSPTCINLNLPTLPSGYTYSCVSAASSSLINGSGWLPLNLASSSIGSLPKLPLDPTNTTSSGLYYTYTTNGTQYELTTILESTKYRLGGSQDKVSTDGGNTSYLYEQGTSQSLSPLNDSGLVGYWTFDEGSGTTVYDRSGNNNNGTWNGTGTHYTTGKVGRAGQFNGINDYVDAGNGSSLNVGTGEFTIVFWTKSLYNGLSAPVSKGGGFNDNVGWSFTFAGSPQALYLLAGSGSSHFEYNMALKDIPDWKFLGMTRNTSGTFSYIRDGQIMANITTSLWDLNNAINLKFGKSDYSGEVLNGSVDEVRIYNRALSRAELWALYNATK